MNTFNGDKYGFVLTETPVGTSQLALSFSWLALPPSSYALVISYRPLSGGSWVNNTGGTTQPRTATIPVGSYEYQATVFYGSSLSDIITFTPVVLDVTNYLFIPKANPLVFHRRGLVPLPKFFTRHFEDYPFEQRGYFWQDRETYCQPWQTTDIINLQLESGMSPLILKIVNCYGDVIQTLSAAASLPHEWIPNLYAYDFSCSLAGYASGIYRAQLWAGFGAGQIVLETGPLLVKDGVIQNTIFFTYSDSSKSHRDTMYATGIKYGIRLPGEFGLLDVLRDDEMWRDQKYNPGLLRSLTSDQHPLILGKPDGLPEDMIKIVHEIWSCDTVTADNKFFGLATNSKIEYTPIKRSRKRYMSMIVEDGLNRNSRIYSTVLDPQKRLLVTGMVDSRVWGVQSGTNTLPIKSIE